MQLIIFVFIASCVTFSTDASDSPHCFKRVSIGERLITYDVTRIVEKKSISGCEEECNIYKCTYFSFGTTLHGNETCELTTDREISRRQDPRFDLYERTEECAEGKPKGYEEACYRRIISGKRLHERFIRHSLPCNSLEACQHQCSIEKHFDCQGFNIRLDPARVGRGVCELSSFATSFLDFNRDFVLDPEFTYYERDRDNESPNCGHINQIHDVIPPGGGTFGFQPAKSGGPYYGGDSYGPWSTGHGTVDHGPWGSHGYGSGFYQSNNPFRGPPPSGHPNTPLPVDPYSYAGGRPYPGFYPSGSLGPQYSGTPSSQSPHFPAGVSGSSNPLNPQKGPSNSLGFPYPGGSTGSQYPLGGSPDARFPGGFSPSPQNPTGFQYSGGESPGSQYPGRKPIDSQYPRGGSPGSQHTGGGTTGFQYPGGGSPDSSYHRGGFPSSQYPIGASPGSQYPSGDSSNSRYPGGSSPGSQLPGGGSPNTNYPGEGSPNTHYPGNYPGFQYPNGGSPGTHYPGGGSLSTQYPSRGGSPDSHYPGGGSPGSRYPIGGSSGSQYPISGSPDSRYSGGDLSGTLYPGGYSPSRYPGSIIPSSLGSQYPDRGSPNSQYPGKYSPGSGYPAGAAPGSLYPGEYSPGTRYPGGSFSNPGGLSPYPDGNTPYKPLPGSLYIGGPFGSRYPGKPKPGDLVPYNPGNSQPGPQSLPDSQYAGGGVSYPKTPFYPGKGSPDFMYSESNRPRPPFPGSSPFNYPLGDRRFDRPSRIPTYIIIDADANKNREGHRNFQNNNQPYRPNVGVFIPPGPQPLPAPPINKPIHYLPPSGTSYGPTQNSIGHEICFRREYPGYKLNPTTIRGMYETPTVLECEAMCNKSPFKCTGYSFRYSTSAGGPNCLLTDFAALNRETHLLPDRSCDVYFKMETCVENDRIGDTVASEFVKCSARRMFGNRHSILTINLC